MIFDAREKLTNNAKRVSLPLPPPIFSLSNHPSLRVSPALGHERDGIRSALNGVMEQDFFLSAAGLAGGAHHRRPVRSTLPALIFAKNSR